MVTISFGKLQPFPNYDKNYHRLRGGEVTSPSQSSSVLSKKPKTKPSHFSPSPPNSSNFNSITNLPPLGESALIDGATSRVYWSSTNLNSIPNISPIPHCKATFLTAVLVSLFLREYFWRVLRAVKNSEALPSSVEIHARFVVRLLYKFKRFTRLLTSAYFTSIFSVLFYPSTSKSTYPKPRLKAAVLITLYVLECLTCSTRIYLSNLSTPKQVEAYIGKVRESKPEVKLKIVNFHYEDRWNGLGIDNGKAMQSNLNRKRIVTNVKTSAFYYDSWWDDTTAFWKGGQEKSSSLMEKEEESTKPLAKIHLSKLLIFSTPLTLKSYLNQQASFINSEEKRDDNYDFECAFTIEGFKGKVLGYRSTPNNNTKLTSKKNLNGVNLQSFCLASILGMTVPYRYYLSKLCSEVNVRVIKYVTCVNANSNSDVKEKEKGDNATSVSPSSYSYRNIGTMLPKTVFGRYDNKVKSGGKRNGSRSESQSRRKFEDLMRSMRIYDGNGRSDTNERC